MTLHIITNDKITTAKTFQYSGGELHVEINKDVSWDNRPVVVARLQKPSDIIELLLLKEIMDRNTPPWTLTTLVIPYLPYARQDRVTLSNTDFGLKVFCDLLNKSNFSSVLLFDTHSDVAAALINNVRVVPQLEIIKKNDALNQFVKENVTSIIAPDAGAYKKANAVSDYFKLPLFSAVKKRSVETGEITGTQVIGDVKGHKVLIVDDMCDGGRTFTELAKSLKENGAEAVFLYITHGIFSKGYAPFNGLIDRIYTTDTFVSESSPSQGEVPSFTHNIVLKEHVDAY